MSLKLAKEPGLKVTVLELRHLPHSTRDTWSGCPTQRFLPLCAAISLLVRAQAFSQEPVRLYWEGEHECPTSGIQRLLSSSSGGCEATHKTPLHQAGLLPWALLGLVRLLQSLPEAQPWPASGRWQGVHAQDLVDLPKRQHAQGMLGADNRSGPSCLCSAHPAPLRGGAPALLSLTTPF